MTQMWDDSEELVKHFLGYFSTQTKKKTTVKHSKDVFSPWSVNSPLQFSRCPELKSLELQRDEFVTSQPKSVTTKEKKTSSPGHKPIFFCSETWSMITLVVLPSSKFGRCSIKREASSIFSATLRQICRLKLHNWHQHSWEVWVWLQRSEQKSLFQLLNSSTFLYSLAKGGTYSKSITNIWRQHNT